MNNRLRFGNLLAWHVTSTTAVASSWTTAHAGHQYDMARVSLACAREHDRRNVGGYYLRADREDGIGTFLVPADRSVHAARVAADILVCAHPEDLVDHDEIPSLLRARSLRDGLGSTVQWRGEQLLLRTFGTEDTLTVLRSMHYDSGWWEKFREGEAPVATIVAEFSRPGPPDVWTARAAEERLDDSDTWHQAMRRVLDRLTGLVSSGDLPSNHMGEYIRA
ncbi:hypothetical protein [Amycolatopsis sp. NPDC004079]|uniref:hypothetical protein n=1 Tax=Amycolatopsis sp. NPDC004079 TaxID=3154549 RepID=UPI0033A740B0